MPTCVLLSAQPPPLALSPHAPGSPPPPGRTVTLGVCVQPSMQPGRPCCSAASSFCLWDLEAPTATHTCHTTLEVNAWHQTVIFSRCFLYVVSASWQPVVNCQHVIAMLNCWQRCVWQPTALQPPPAAIPHSISHMVAADGTRADWHGAAAMEEQPDRI